MLARYDTIAEGLPPPLRASAAVTIADLWARFLRYDRARVLYREVLETAAPGLDTSDIRRRLHALPAGALRLRPAEVVNDRRVELTWVRPSTDTVQAYVVYRARSRDSEGEHLAQLTPADAPAYSDRTVRPGTEYWYRVKARTGSGELISNPIHTTVASDSLAARAMVLSPVDHLLYVFGYLENRFPRVYQVSQTGEVRATFDGAFYGLERYAKEDHRWDSYVDEAWFVDVTGQQFLRFPRSPSGFGDDVREATHAGWDLVSVDTATMPYYGVVVAVDAAGRVSKGRGDTSRQLGSDLSVPPAPVVHRCATTARARRARGMGVVWRRRSAHQSGLDGKELARLTAWRGPMHVAPDTATGALWVLAGSRLLRLIRDGKPIVDARLPVR